MSRIILSNPKTTPQPFGIKKTDEDTIPEIFMIPASSSIPVFGVEVLRPDETTWETVSVPSLVTPWGISPDPVQPSVWLVVGAIVSYAFVKSCGKY